MSQAAGVTGTRRERRWVYISGAFALLGILVSCSIGVHIWRVDAGYCSKNGRYITDEEILEHAIEYFINRDVFSRKRFESRVANGESQDGPNGDPRMYRSVEEFLQENPKCCQIVERGEDGYSVGLIHRYAHGYTAIVRGQYASRYIDDVGELRSDPVDRYVIVSNCGDVRNPD